MTPGLTYFAVAVEAVPAMWPSIEKFIGAGCEGDTVLISAEDLLPAAMMGAYQLWVITRNSEPVGAFLSTTSQLPGGRQMDIEFLGGGDFFEWGPQLWSHFEANAKAQGITVIRMCGRPGWARVFRGFGYQPDIVIASKRL